MIASAHWRRFTAALLVAWVALAVVLDESLLPGLQTLERRLQDQRLQWTAPHTPEDRLVVVDIDEASLREPQDGGQGRWPWPRDRLALLIERLFQEHRVAAIGLDIVLAGQADPTGLALARQLRQWPGTQSPALQQALDRALLELDHDRRLAQAMSLGPVVVGDAFHTGGGSSGLAPPGLDPASWGPVRARIRSHDQHVGVVPELREAAAGSGHLHPLRDDDGVTRRVPLFVEHAGRWHPALVLSLLQAWTESPPPQPLMQAYGGQSQIEAVAVGPMQVPVDRDLQAIVPYRHPQAAVPSVSATAIINRQPISLALEGRLVLVGSSAVGLSDLVTTPLHASLPGVQVHAQLLAGILDERVPQQPAYAQGATLALVLTMGLLAAWAGNRVKAVGLLVTAAVALVAVIGLNLWLWWGQHLLLPLAAPVVAVLLPTAWHMGWGYVAESQARRQMASLFAHYVPPEIVARMAADPAAYDMKPQARELTVLFADVRGFTSISEQLAPQALADYINDYLTAMSRVIREGHHGTLDKYIGDAVMAFWGAPVDEAAHAQRAVAAALDMQEAVQLLNAEFQQRGWPRLAIGVGVNSGPMRVGDMGSRIRRAYTVMGDAVNLASRLEGLTRPYGVGVLIGAHTRALLGPQWVCREIDRVRVKGKDEPVSIFEPVGLVSRVPLPVQAAIDQWHQVLALTRSRAFAQALIALQALEQADTDEGARGHYRRLAAQLLAWQTEPPGPDWDGVTRFDSK